MRTKGTIIINLDKRKVGAAIAALGILVVGGFTTNRILANNHHTNEGRHTVSSEVESTAIDWSTEETTTVETTVETTTETTIETTTQVPRTEETTV